MTNIIKIKERDCVIFSVYGLMFNGGLGNLGRIGSLRNLGQTPNTPTRQIGPKGLQGLIGQKRPKRYCHREQLGEVKRKKYDFLHIFFATQIGCMTPL